MLESIKAFQFRHNAHGFLSRLPFVLTCKGHTYQVCIFSSGCTVVVAEVLCTQRRAVCRSSPRIDLKVECVQVVVAPHIYPPSISKATDLYSGSGLYNRLTKSFGSLNKEGYCLADGTCHQFAVAIGETGTAFTDARDTPSMADFAKYLTNTGDGQYFGTCTS